MRLERHDEKAKKLFKLAMIELLRENPLLLRQAVQEVMEDVGVARAIEEVRQGEYVEQEDVYRVLDKATARARGLEAVDDASP